MARVSKICDRDGFGKENPATTTRSFRIGDTNYRLDLCEAHAVMFDREMMGWIRVAAEDENYLQVRGMRTIVTPQQLEDDRRTARLREQQTRMDAEVDQLRRAETTPLVLPGDPAPDELSRRAMRWVLTPHAEQRMKQREYTLAQVLEAAENPEQSYQGTAKYGVNNRIHQRGDCAVVVNPVDRVVISVLHRDRARYGDDVAPPTPVRMAQ